MPRMLKTANPYTLARPWCSHRDMVRDAAAEKISKAVRVMRRTVVRTTGMQAFPSYREQAAAPPELENRPPR
ncbi:hypothetical protein GCM10009872_01000 [Actinopolymorpha rutila]